MLLSGVDGEPRYFELPEHLCMKVKIEHPTNEGINSMGLEWFGLPGHYQDVIGHLPGHQVPSKFDHRSVLQG